MDIAFYSIYNYLPEPVQKSLLLFINTQGIDKPQMKIALSILTHITANQYVYKYIDDPEKYDLRKQQVTIYNEIKNNISRDNFKVLSTFLQLLISEYNKLVVKNPAVQHILIVRRNLISIESKRIKNLNPEKTDFECWITAEKTFVKQKIDINKLLTGKEKKLLEEPKKSKK